MCFLLLMKVSAYGFMTPDYKNYSDHYYDKTYHGVGFFINHDLRMEMTLWQQLHQEGLIRLYMHKDFGSNQKWCHPVYLHTSYQHSTEGKQMDDFSFLGSKWLWTEQKQIKLDFFTQCLWSALIQTEIILQTLDASWLNLVQICNVLRGWILMTLTISWFFYLFFLIYFFVQHFMREGRCPFLCTTSHLSHLCLSSREWKKHVLENESALL